MRRALTRRMAIEKKTDAVTVHLPRRLKLVLEAAAEAADQSPSEYLRALVKADAKRLEREYRIYRRAFSHLDNEIDQNDEFDE